MTVGLKDLGTMNYYVGVLGIILLYDSTVVDIENVIINKFIIKYCENVRVEGEILMVTIPYRYGRESNAYKIYAGFKVAKDSYPREK